MKPSSHLTQVNGVRTNDIHAASDFAIRWRLVYNLIIHKQDYGVTAAYPDKAFLTTNIGLDGNNAFVLIKVDACERVVDATPLSRQEVDAILRRWKVQDLEKEERLATIIAEAMRRGGNHAR